MNYGLYLSASGVLTSMYRQDVFANNLANADTPGFKPIMPAIREREPEAIEEGFGMDVSQKLLDQLGGGALASPGFISFGQGALRVTDKPLDVAVQAKDQFFAVAFNDPNTAEIGVRLTRNGQFSVSPTGQLVNQSGYQVLDMAGDPIEIPAGTLPRIEANGMVTADGEAIAQLQVSRINDLQALSHVGENLFAMPDQQDLRDLLQTNQVQLSTGGYEGSAVNAISAMSQMVAATKAGTGNARMMQYHDTLMDRAVNTLGRVA